MEQEASKTRLSRVVSGGQTGVDRAALDAALALGIEHGGWCPRGRKAEDGKIPQRYELVETADSKYWVRTEQNVVDSCGTLILYREKLTGGTALTKRMAKKHARPCLEIDLSESPETQNAKDWIKANAIHTLNVAGPRESTSPGIADEAKEFMQELLNIIQVRSASE